MWLFFDQVILDFTIVLFDWVIDIFFLNIFNFKVKKIIKIKIMKNVMKCIRIIIIK